MSEWSPGAIEVAIVSKNCYNALKFAEDVCVAVLQHAFVFRWQHGFSKNPISQSGRSCLHDMACSADRVGSERPHGWRPCARVTGIYDCEFAASK
jgi:hypothetical protein